MVEGHAPDSVLQVGKQAFQAGDAVLLEVHGAVEFQPVADKGPLPVSVILLDLFQGVGNASAAVPGQEYKRNGGRQAFPNDTEDHGVKLGQHAAVARRGQILTFDTL